MRGHGIRALCLLQLFTSTVLSGTLLLYSGSQCADTNPITVSGTDDGLCTQIYPSFWSMKVGTIEPNCAITVYGSNNTYCGLGYSYVLNEGQCYGNISATSINQLTVDCESTTIDPTTPSSKSGGLSHGAKIGIGIGVPFGILAVLGLLAFFFVRHRKKYRAVAAAAGAEPTMYVHDPAMYHQNAAMSPHDHPPMTQASMYEAQPNPMKRPGFGNRKISELDGGSTFELPATGVVHEHEGNREVVSPVPQYEGPGTPGPSWGESTTTRYSAV